MRLYQITLDYACFGIETKRGIVVNTAPIAKWMKGKSIMEIRQWVSRKKGKMKEIP